MAKPLDFPSSFPSRLILGLVLFPMVTGLAYVAWFIFLLTPLERQYLGPYMSSAMLEGKTMKATFRPVLLTSPGHRPALAHDADVVGLSPFSNPAMPFELSTAARAAGWTGLSWSDKRLYPAAELGLLLREQFFAGKSLAVVFLPLTIGIVLLVFLTDRLCNRVGLRSGHEDRHGRRTKGPELRTPASLKRSSKVDGIRLRLVGRRFDRRGRSFAIPKKLESSHILLMGDTGSGKSNTIRQILQQVGERGESAIVYDPAGEFVQEFYRPDRGDLILNRSTNDARTGISEARYPATEPPPRSRPRCCPRRSPRRASSSTHHVVCWLVC